MICPKCGKEIENDVAFCKYCGADLRQTEKPVKTAQNTESKSIEDSLPNTEPENTEIISNLESSTNPVTKEAEIPAAASNEQNNTNGENSYHTEPYADNTLTQTNSAFSNEQQPHIAEKQKKPLSLKKLLIPVTVVFALILFGIISSSVAKNKIVDIKVVYSGKTEAGIIIDENNTGISVTGIKKDGTEKELTNWKVEDAKTLENDSISNVTVQYKKISKEITVKCSSSAIVSITAKYEGNLSAGTSIKANNITVTALHRNGTTTTITQDCIITPDTVTLKKDGKEKIHVTYNDFSCDVELVCSDKTITDLSAEYTGELLAGEELKTGSRNIKVIVTYKDGTKETVSTWKIDQPTTLEWEKQSDVTITYEGQTCSLSVFCTSNLKAISAEYVGSVEAGTKIANGNSNIKVTATYKDDKTEIVKGWKIDRDVTLEWGKEETMTVTYKDMSCPLKILCKSDIKEITAVYNGETEAGTEIKKGSTIVVTATKEDGTTKTITDWTMDQSVTLEADKTAEITIRYKDKTCTLKVTCSTMSDAKYKTICESISYSELARNPQKYEERNVKFTGTVLQVMEEKYSSKTIVALRVATKWGYSKYIDDVVYVIYVMDNSSPRILEDDTVTFYGMYSGLYTYETVMGASVTIPKVVARIIDTK